MSINPYALNDVSPLQKALESTLKATASPHLISFVAGTVTITLDSDTTTTASSRRLDALSGDTVQEPDSNQRHLRPNVRGNHSLGAQPRTEGNPAKFDRRLETSVTSVTSRTTTKVTGTTVTQTTTVAPQAAYAAFEFTFVLTDAGATAKDAFSLVLGLQNADPAEVQKKLEQYLPKQFSILDDGTNAFFQWSVPPRAFMSTTVKNKASDTYLSPSNAGNYLKPPEPPATIDDTEAAVILGSSVGGGIFLFCCCGAIWCSVLRIPSRIARRASRRGEEFSAKAEAFSNDFPGMVAWFIANLPAMLVKLQATVRRKTGYCCGVIWKFWAPFFDKNYASGGKGGSSL